jgi:pimeloyl-ACP methyl ester carboxylesterase
MPKVQLASGLTLHYQRVGEGPDLVLIHGLTGNLASWHLRVVPLLRDHFRILTYDLRGHGYSDIPPTGYTTGDMAEDLKGLLDALEIERPALVGHSYGADTALYFSLLSPERVDKVIAAESGLAALIKLRTREDWEGWAYWWKALERFGLSVPVDKRYDIDYMLRMSLQVPKQTGPAIGRNRKPEPILRLLETSMVPDYEVVGDLSIENIPRIKTPVLLVYGAGSAFLGTCTYLQAQLPDVQTVLLPRSDWEHFGPLEQPQLFAATVLDYLKPTVAAGERSHGTTPA